jgi:hypothetical protein
MNENKPILRNPLTGFAENLWDENVVTLKKQEKKKAAAAAAAAAAAPAAPADAAAAAPPRNTAAANSNSRKNKTLKKSLGKRNLFQSNANRLKQIQNEENARIAEIYGTSDNLIPNKRKNENIPLNPLPSGERSFLNRMKSFVTRPFRSSPEATLTKSSTNKNNSHSFRKITNNTIISNNNNNNTSNHTLTNNNIKKLKNSNHTRTNNNIKKLSKTRKRKY